MNKRKIYTVLGLASIIIGLIAGMIVVRRSQDLRNRAQEQPNSTLPISVSPTPAQCPGDGASCEWNDLPGVPGYCYRLEENKDGEWVAVIPSENGGTFKGKDCIPTQETKIVFRAEPGVQYRCIVKIDTPITECEKVSSDSATLVCTPPSITPPSGTVTVVTGTPGTGTPGTGTPGTGTPTSTPTGSPTPSSGQGTGMPTATPSNGTGTPTSGVGTGTPTSGNGTGTTSTSSSGSNNNGSTTITNAVTSTASSNSNSSSNSSSSTLPRAGFVETTLVLAALGLVVLIVGFTL